MPEAASLAAFQGKREKDSTQICHLTYHAMQDVVAMCDDVLSGLSGINKSSTAVSSHLEVSMSCPIVFINTYAHSQGIPCREILDAAPIRELHHPRWDAGSEP